MLATIKGTNPMNNKTINHKFPVVILYACIISLNVAPIINSKTVSKITVSKTHNIPIWIYVFLTPLPSNGIRNNETIKIKQHNVIPLIGLEYFSPIKGVRTKFLKPPFKIPKTRIEPHINIDFSNILLLMLFSFHLNKDHITS